MTTNPPNGDDGGAPDPTEPPLDFDPYRYGAPEHPIPLEYAPPGYVPPPVAPQYPYPYGSAGHPGTGFPPGPNNPGGSGYQPPPPSGYPGGYPTGAPDPRFPPPVPPQYNPYPQPSTGNGKAITALVCGIASVALFWLSILDVPIVLAIVFGVLGRRESERLPGRAGRGMATAGLILGLVGLVLAVVFVIWVFDKLRPCLNSGLSSSERNHCISNHM